ncbi:MAG: ferrous iron transport protein B [Nitrososphaerales archaeon]|nr:ferrous iron transport protein B [Nitrososphaerales archaeon]
MLSQIIESKIRKQTNIHTAEEQSVQISKRIILVGSPNTGKSIIFNALTGTYTSVSNYPGTTVEVAKGKSRIDNETFEVLDTPGMYSLIPVTEEEDVTRRIIMETESAIIIHVIDAKNLDRMLPLTLQLIEAGLPIILVLNMMDEAKKRGVGINSDILQDILGIPVVKTVAVTGEGITQLRKEINNITKNQTHLEKKQLIVHNPTIESAISKITPLISNNTISRRALALLFLQDDQMIKRCEGKSLEKEITADIRRIVKKAQESLDEPIRYVTAMKNQDEVNHIVSKVVSEVSNQDSTNLPDRLSRIMTRPLTGIPIFLLVTYFGLYQFVGVFGAGTIVDFLEATVFEEYITPYIISLATTFIPWETIQDLFVGEYGVFTLGLRYAIAIILPIVGTFFFAFAIVEDTGYLPRMALLIDRGFKKIGLSGRAVIPMTLGFGCGTMATMVTRTLETKRERVIATILLALAIPCSAQLGVILGILSGNSMVTLIWMSTVLMTLLGVGLLTAIIIPGEKPSFYMELPPLRLPKLSNLISKTYTRMEWYFIEILPLFLLASLLIWLGQETGIFQIIVGGMTPLVNSLGLPDKAAEAFLFGFFRRDFGAAGLYDLQKAGLLSPLALVVSAVTITLFVPCIAQFSIMIKERGLKTAISIAAFVFPFAFFVGYMLNWTLGGII